MNNARTSERLDEMLGFDDFDEDFLPPTPAVLAFVRPLIEGLLGGSSSCVGGGDVFLEWNAGENVVRVLAWPKNGEVESYVYAGEQGGGNVYPIDQLRELLARFVPAALAQEEA